MARKNKGEGGIGAGERGPFATPRFVVTAVFTAAVVVFGTVVVVAGGEAGEGRASTGSVDDSAGTSVTQEATPSPEPSLSVSGPPVLSGAQRACAAPVGRDAPVPTRAPAEVSWSDFRGMLLPASSEGPAVIDHNVARCFTHTPVGALLAAVHISSRLFLAAEWRAVAEQSVVAGPERDEMVMGRADQESREGTPAPPAPHRLAQISGFQFVSYSEETAVIKVLKGGPQTRGGLKSVLYTLMWVDGDWKLRLAPDGSDSFTVQQADSWAGFVRWGAAAEPW